MKSFLLVKNFGGLVEMTFGLVNASFSLPEWQAVKMTFFARCDMTFALIPFMLSLIKVFLHTLTSIASIYLRVRFHYHSRL